MKKLIALFLAALMLVSLVACGEKAPEEPEGPITITVWTCNSGDTGEWLTQAAARFNESQDKYIVEQSYAGSYSEVLTKLSATTGEWPDIFHSDTESAYTYYLMKDKYVPIQKYIDEDKHDMSAIMGNLASTYSDAEGNWQCMPLGNTVTGFFYNPVLLEQAGVNPDTDLGSYEEITEACRKLKAIGVESPFYLHTSSGFYSFPMTAQGIQYVDNNNGKDGAPTKSLIGEPGECRDATIDFFQNIKTMKAEGLMVPFGTTTGDGRALFVEGKCAIMCAFISGFNTVYNAVDGKFPVAFHTAPTINKGAKNVGQCTGGGCLFLANNNNPAKERGAWEFMKFLTNDENTVGYAKVSGYLPISTTGAATQEYKDFMATKFPTAQQSLDAQAATPPTTYNAWLPMFNDFHALCKQYYGVAYDNDALSAEEITDQFAKAVDEAIEMWQLSQG